MKKLIFAIISKFMTVDTVCSFIGYLLGKLLAWARKFDKWDSLKEIIHKVRGWVDLVDDVIEDDTLTADEEKLIVDALKDTKEVSKISEVLVGEEHEPVIQ